jgi:hypothetical protein
MDVRVTMAGGTEWFLLFDNMRDYNAFKSAVGDDHRGLWRVYARQRARQREGTFHDVWLRPSLVAGFEPGISS